MAPDQQTASDAELATRARDGDDESFAVLYERFFPKVLDFLARLLGDRSAAEEIAQDAFVAAYEHRSTLRQPEAVRSWLFSIAYRRAMDHLRRTGRERAGLPEAAEVGVEEDPAARLAGAEAAELVWAAAQSLEARQYAVLDLSVRQGLAGQEVARALGVNQTHAAVLGHRARAALAKAVTALLVARSPERCPVLGAAGALGASATRGAGEPLPALSRQQRASVERHIRECPHCTSLAKRLAAPAALLGAFLPVAPAAGHGRWALVAERIQPAPGAGGPAGSTPDRFPRARRGRRAAVGAGVAFLLLAGLGLGLHLGDGTHVAGRSAPVTSGEGAIRPGSFASVPALTWRVVPSPDPGGPAVPTFLTRLTCSDVDACWAAGSYNQTVGGSQPLVIRRVGGVWQVSPVAGTMSGSELGALGGITCVDPTDCWAVGDRMPLPGAGTSAPNAAPFASYRLLTAILHFDGHSWSLVASPSEGGPDTIDDLSNVSCASVSNCWAAGFWSGLGPTATQHVLHPLLLHFDGTAWSLSPVPNIGPARAFYSNLAVVCVSATSCWMTGDYTAPDGRVLALAARLGATGWRSMPLPDPGSQVHWAAPVSPGVNANMAPNAFGGIACPGPNDCWGAEEYLNPAGLLRFQLLHFDGRTWKPASTPDPVGPAGEAMLGAISCPAAGDCWALGNMYPGDSPAAFSREKAFALHFDGRSWRFVALPDPGVPYLSAAGGKQIALPSEEAYGLRCPSVRLCVIAGTFEDGRLTGTQSLVIEGTGP
jgi:RNA polymerase sigma factor (sigma-70 family)